MKEISCKSNGRIAFTVAVCIVRVAKFYLCIVMTCIYFFLPFLSSLQVAVHKWNKQKVIIQNQQAEYTDIMKNAATYTKNIV